MQITVTLNDSQSAAVLSAAEKTGKDSEQVLLEAVDLLALRDELGPDGFAELMAGIADDAAGRYASDKEVDAVFKKYGARP